MILPPSSDVPDPAPWNQVGTPGQHGSPDPEPFHQARPYPCPECFSTKGYSRVGKYRSQCLGCNALLKNAEVNLEDQEPQ